MLRSHVGKYSDPMAMHILGDFYIDGQKGPKKSQAKAMELYQNSYSLGSADAADQLVTTTHKIPNFVTSTWKKPQFVVTLINPLRLANKDCTMARSTRRQPKISL